MAAVQNVKVGGANPEALMFDKYQTKPSDYQYDLREWIVNEDAGNTVEISNDKIVIKKFKPNLWIIKTTNYASLSKLCAGSKNLTVGISGIGKHSDLFGTQYKCHSVVGASGGTIGVVAGVGIFPFSNSVPTWVGSSMGSYALNRGELPFSAYVWDSLTLTDGSKVQVGSETSAFRSNFSGSGYNTYGKIKDTTAVKVIPDYTTFPTPYATLALSLGLYTGNAISFDAWKCENKVNSLKMTISQRNVADEGSTQSAFCSSNFGTIKIRISGLADGDRLEYGNGIIAESDSSITADGEYSITSGSISTQGTYSGFILYGDTANTDPVTIELIDNAYLDEDGYVDISDSPITVYLVNNAGVNVPSVECWDAYVGDTQVYHKDKTVENCWMKYRLMFPNNYNLYSSTFTSHSNVEWLSAVKFKLNGVPAEGISIYANKTQNDNSYITVSYIAFNVKVFNKPAGTTIKLRRVVENVQEDVTEEITLAEGLNEIPAFSQLVYRDDSTSTIDYTECEFVVEGETDATDCMIELVPIYTDGELRKVYTDTWSKVYNSMQVPVVTDEADYVAKTKFRMKPVNTDVWEAVKTWYEENVYDINNFTNGNIFNNSSGLTEITINIPDDSFQYGEDNFANSSIETINFVQTTENSHFSAPQRLLRSAWNLRNINITWANEEDEDRYLCKVNTTVDGISNGLVTYPERLINWEAYTNIGTGTIPCTLFQYTFNSAYNLTEIPSFPVSSESDVRNIIVPALGVQNSFANCSSLVTIGPVLDFCLVRPSLANNVFQNCKTLTTMKLKNLNHGDWNFDNVTRTYFHGTLEALDESSVQYLFSNLADLTTYNADLHESTIYRSFQSWSSSYWGAKSKYADPDYYNHNIKGFTCKKRGATVSAAPMITSTNQTFDLMNITIQGLQSGDSLVFVTSGSSEAAYTFTEDGSYDIVKTSTDTMGFKLVNADTTVTSPVIFYITKGLDYTNPNASSANLYCPSTWESYITDDMVTAANAKGWSIYVGGELYIPYYGVEFDVTVSSSSLTRIGNLSAHKSLPIQSQLKGCIAQAD